MRLFPPAVLAVAVSGALLLGALAFQFIGGLPPCEMCYWQRYAHVAVIVLAAPAVVLPPAVARLLVIGAIVALFVSAGLALFHVGVEWKWWDGPTACSGGSLLGLDPKDAARRMMETPLVRCDEIPWSLFGISMAGYNFLISLIAGLAVAQGQVRSYANDRRR